MASDDYKAKSQIQFGAAVEGYATSDIHSAGESLGLLVDLIPTEKNWRVLDVATGAGHTAFAFSPHVASVVATDITDAMLEKTAELARDKGLANVETKRADAESLPFDDASFDLVTCRLAHHHFPNPQHAIDEMARVLKPQGWIGFADNYTVEAPNAAVAYNAYERLRDPSHHEVLPRSQLENLFASARLSIQQRRFLTKEFEFQKWADRQHVSDDDKLRLLQMMREIPDELAAQFAPRWANETMYFTLWEAVFSIRNEQT